MGGHISCECGNESQCSLFVEEDLWPNIDRPKIAWLSLAHSRIQRMTLDREISVERRI
jgi:hypothetical protein